MTTQVASDWVRLQVVCARVPCSEQTARKYIRNGLLVAKRLGGRVWVSSTSLEQFLAGEPVGPSKNGLGV